MRALIVDDEASARSRLRRQLAMCPHIAIEGEADNGIAALDQILALKPELVFLDIQMPGMTGFEVLRNLPPELDRPHVVFVTGFDDHALAAFDADAIAYLLKPVQQDRLIQVVERIERLHGRSSSEKLDHVAAALSPPMRQVVVRHANRFLLLRPEDIALFRCEDGITRAFTSAESYSVNLQISELEAALSGEQFFRASRADLINLYRIREVRPFLKSTFIVVMNNAARTEIQVGERRAKALRQKIPGL
ncbi:MAG: response regulator transcription factor [Acidobacteriaceae bacterium]|nr:response regulator transcription factor [Acidobacteriaceae bacterium]